MGKRSKGRQLLVQALYASAISGGDLLDCLDDQVERRAPAPETVAYVRSLAAHISAHRAELDRSLDDLLEHWDPSRVGQVERAIFRLALAELKFQPEVPVRVVINEACELARLFVDERAVGFVNGLLDRAAAGAKAQEDVAAPEPPEVPE